MILLSRPIRGLLPQMNRELIKVITMMYTMRPSGLIRRNILRTMTVIKNLLFFQQDLQFQCSRKTVPWMHEVIEKLNGSDNRK